MSSPPLSMISLESWPWVKSIELIVRVVRIAMTILSRRPRKLVLVQRNPTWWNSGQAADKSIVNLCVNFAVTNPNEHNGVVVVRVQIGRTGFVSRRILQDCHFCDIAGERVSPLTPGVSISPRTTATMQLTHPFEVDRPPPYRAEILSFRVIATDQLNRRHITRIKLQRFGR